MKNLSFILLFICPLALFSVERMPWTETDLILYPRLDVLYQHYQKIQSSKKSQHGNADDIFFTPALSGSYAPWSVEVALTAAKTDHQGFGFDNIRLTGSYQWMNDIIYDPASIAFGLSYIAASKSALYDISSFHHGRNEVEFYISFGKEDTQYNTWGSRWWGVGVFGLADHGSPWYRLTAAWEKNIHETFLVRLFADGLFGMGGEALDLEHHFKGYGPIKHRSVDIGIHLTKLTECRGFWIFEYTRRVYARNFPENTNLFQCTFVYPYPL